MRASEVPVITDTPNQPLRLVVLVSEPISEWIEKGEVVDRYYNPGDLFDEVYLVICSEDSPDIDKTQRLVGRAKLKIENFPLSKSTRILTLGLQPELLFFWLRPVSRYVKRINPALIRCHGATQNAMVALKVKKSVGIPYVVSLHTNPDVELRGRHTSFLHHVYNILLKRIEKKSLRGSDLVMPVYLPIVPYLKRLGVTRYRVHYNVLNAALLSPKTDYDLSSPIRLICVGRLYASKNPYEILRAVARISNVRLAIVGDGPLRSFLQDSAELLGVAERIDFLPAVPNDDLCALLKASDIFVVHTEAWEISKSVLEALLTGLPVIINQRIGEPVPELHSRFVKLVSNNASEYEVAIRELIGDRNLRSQLGKNAAEVSHDLWAPEKCESAVVDTYRSFLNLSYL